MDHKVKTLLIQLQKLREGEGLDRDDLPSRLHGELRTALGIQDGQPDDELRADVKARLLSLVQSVCREQDRQPILVAYRMDPDFQQDTTEARREQLSRKTHDHPDTLRKHREDRGLEAIAIHLINEGNKVSPGDRPEDQTSEIETNGDPQSFPDENSGPVSKVPSQPTPSRATHRRLIPVILVFIALAVGFWTWKAAHGQSSSEGTPSTPYVVVGAQPITIVDRIGTEYIWSVENLAQSPDLFLPGKPVGRSARFEGDVVFRNLCPGVRGIWMMVANGQVISSGTTAISDKAYPIDFTIHGYLGSFTLSAWFGPGESCAPASIVWLNPVLVIDG